MPPPRFELGSRPREGRMINQLHYGGIAPPGFEPGSTDPESAMLRLPFGICPLHYGALLRKEKANLKIYLNLLKKDF